MESIVITIHPSGNNADEVRAIDALDQAADLLRLLESVGRFMHEATSPPVWRLLRASTNSPLTLEVTVEESADIVDVEAFVSATRDEFLSSVRELAANRVLPAWLNDDNLPRVQNVFRRTTDGLGAIEVGNGNGKRVVIDHAVADVVVPILDSVPTVAVDAGSGEEQAWGEIEGTIVSVGTFYKRPAFRLWSRQLEKPIWCVVSSDSIESFGSKHTVNDIWTNKRVAVLGRVIYRDGNVVRVLDSKVRDLPDVRAISIDAVRDPDFTGGLDPVEYLRRFHEGELVG